MAYFGKFYLDKEKDIIITLDLEDEKMTYTLETPYHQTNNLISNLAKVCNLSLIDNRYICDHVPCYFDGDNNKVYILRMNDTKVANIYPDKTIERKAYVPAIAKIFMSQSKDCSLDIRKVLVKTYIRSEVKFHTDLHTHRSANLSPDLCIALGIYHQIRYPYYYIKKLNLKLNDEQYNKLESQRKEVYEIYKDCGLKGKYLDRRIDDNTEINFADLILNNLENSTYNINKIRTSLALLKDGQAVFTNLEKVYLYRYVFTKGIQAKQSIELHDIDKIEDVDIVNALKKMFTDHQTKEYANNTLYQDKLLWTARSYKKMGITYAEISDTALVKRSEAASTLKEIHEVMPHIIKETGVILRFLCALRRIPLTIIKDDVKQGNYFTENLQVLKAVASDPYIAGSDFVGEEINDIKELKPVIRSIIEISKDIPSYVVRIHAGENDSLPDNVLNSILCVKECVLPNERFPHMRIGHGLYTANLNTNKGKQLLSLLRENNVVLEFQLSSNVRLNNLSNIHKHPLKQYLNADVLCVQGSDGCALYGSDCIDEQLSLERMLELEYYDLFKMRKAEDHVLNISLNDFNHKKQLFNNMCNIDIQTYYEQQIKECESDFITLPLHTRKIISEEVFKDKIIDMPLNKIPIVVAGGSFNNAHRITRMKQEECDMIDAFIKEADPNKVFFVIGPTLTGYERYIYEKCKDTFEVFMLVPNTMLEHEYQKIKDSDANIRVSIESSLWGTYKSFAYEIFKRRQSILLALDGNSAASNLIQDAKNSKYKSRTFISVHSRSLKSKADSLQGYVTLLTNEEDIFEIIKYVDKYYANLGNLEAQMYHRGKKI